MNKVSMFLSLILLVSRITLASQESKCKRPYLILHFDINKTIIAMDAVQGKDQGTTINGILAEFTFAKWDGEQTQSYYAYVTDQIAQENPQLSKISENFKKLRSERLKEFPDYIAKKQPVLLEPYTKDKTAMTTLLSSGKMVIFPSFYKAIKWLNDTFPQKYMIHLRTFGRDLPDVVPTLEKHTQLRFTYGSPTGSAQDRWQYIASLNTHCAIQDDYAHWKAAGFQSAGGKPFPIDSRNPHVLSIFFDDNADDREKPIIMPVGPNGQLEDVAALLKKGNIVAVNPKEAILDENYFINKIKALLPQP
jgi:hypothetical protein